MAANPLVGLESLGQSIWLDFISRGTIASGDLAHRIEEDHLRGVTSNPSIFQKAISGSSDYDADIQRLAEAGHSDLEVYESLAIADIQAAADAFSGVYEKTRGGDGYVSLEVSPHLAHDTDGTVEEARRLWERLDRPNVMIKVPGTKAGLPAFRTLIGEGINVNVTLLFGVPRYEEVIDAYMGGIEDLIAPGGDPSRVASVASFFLSRIDVMVDPMLQERIDSGEEAAGLLGETAIASAKIAYERFGEWYGRPRWKELEAAGAAPQRLLWASTSTKNPDYDDVMYVEPLIGPLTVNTLPVETLDAYRDHGDPAVRIEDDLEKAHNVMDRLSELGIDIDAVTQALEEEGVEKFVLPFDKLMGALKEARSRVTA